MYHCSKTKLCIQRKRTHKNPNSSEIKRENLGAFEAKPRKAIKSIPLLSADLICFVLCKYVPVKPLGITEASKAQGRVLLATGTHWEKACCLVHHSLLQELQVHNSQVPGVRRSWSKPTDAGPCVVSHRGATQRNGGRWVLRGDGENCAWWNAAVLKQDVCF